MFQWCLLEQVKDAQRGHYGTMGSDLWFTEPWTGRGPCDCLGMLGLGALEVCPPSEVPQRTLRGAGEDTQACAWRVRSSNTPATVPVGQGLLEGTVLCD